MTFILAADNAQFGQLEVTVDITPGGGGTQRLTRSIGKSKAMEMCLSGRLMDGAEAEPAGLASWVVPVATLVDEAIRTATRIASLSKPVVAMIKECVNRAYETSLAEGLLFERRTLHSALSLQDQKEGMTAFVEKRAYQYSQIGNRPYARTGLRCVVIAEFTFGLTNRSKKTRFCIGGISLCYNRLRRRAGRHLYKRGKRICRTCR